MTTQFACQAFATAADVFAAESCPLASPADDEVVNAALDMASDMLYLLSGGRITGRCTSTVYPESLLGCSDGEVLNSRSVIALRGPATAVIEVLIDGVALATDAYVLVDGSLLMRVEGDWPSSNDGPRLASTLDDTWSIRYSFGRPADFLTKAAAVELAIEMALGSLGRDNALPAGVIAANIQGASLSLEDRASSLGEGRDGLPALARFLGIYGSQDVARSLVWSPELDYGYELHSR